MRFSLSPLTGRPAVAWALSWFAVATVLTFTLWKPLFHLVPYFAYFAATALIAARTGARMGIGAALAAVASMLVSRHYDPDEVVVRSVSVLLNSFLVIWLGSQLRRETKHSAEYQTGINEAVADFVWAMTPKYDVTFINDRCAQYLGKTIEQLRVVGWDDAVPPEAGAEVMAALEEAERERRPASREHQIRRHDGHLAWFFTRVAPIFNARGELVRLIGTSTDIEDRKKIEFEREKILNAERAARAEAEEASRAKDEFLSTLSHELRTPLNAIMGWIYIAQHEHLVGAELEEALDIVDRNARAQLRLIEDLLEMSRIITGKIRLNVQSVDLALVILAAVDSVRVSAEAKEIRLRPVLDPLAGPVRGDPDRLQQVMWNLLTNAIKFTPKGGSVDLALERVESHVEITVSDTGIGIAPAFLPHVFERFRQEDSSSTRNYEGLGLGLAIVKQLVEIQGGTVVAKSAGLGKGATFRIALPLPAAQPRDEIAPDLPPVPAMNGNPAVALKNLRVLVVDDDQDARGLVARILSGHGAEVTLASSAREALDELQKLRYHTLISDIGMPVEDGCELIRHVRRLEVTRGGGIPAIALTAFARNEERLRAIRAGYDVFLSKPVDAAELTAIVSRCATRA